MRSLFIFLLGLLLALPAAAETEKDVTHSIDQVTVFLSGAQVKRSGSFSAKAGVTELIFDELSPTLDPNSIQATGKGNFIILDVRKEMRYPEPIRVEETEMPSKLKKEWLALEDSVVEIDFFLQDLQDRKSALEREKAMLLENKLMNGGGHSDSLPILKDAMDFFRKKIEDINANLLKVKKDLYLTQKDKNRMSTRLTELRNWKTQKGLQGPQAPQPTTTIVVTVSANYSVSGSVEISYLVGNAGWTPSYDLRAEDVNQPVTITYKAKVFQSSGEDWNRVNLSLSSADPRQFNIRPVLNPWFVSYYVAMQIAPQGMTNLSMPTRSTSNNEAVAEDDMDGTSVGYNGNSGNALSSSLFSLRQNTLTNFSFDIKLKYSIPSDGQPHLVAVHEDKINAEYEHFVVPKMDKKAFLVAKCVDWEDLNLLAGPANLYYAGTFVGRTNINPASLSDTLELSMGHDQGLTVDRKKLKDEDKEKIVGGKKVKKVTIELTVRNNKAGTVTLEVLDQYPVTRDKDIEIELVSAGGADINEDDGKLTWRVKLGPRKTKKLKFTYTIKYDKDKSLV